MVMGARCDKPEPKPFIASHIERRPVIEDDDNNVLFSVTLCSLLLKSRSTSEFPCAIIRIFLTILDNVGYFGNPETVVNDNTLFK